MRLDNKIYTCWINVNRSCNLRCKWCYAQSTKYNSADMSIDDAKKVVDIFADYGVRHFIILGGEPTIYNYLSELLDYIYYKNSTCTIVTNAIKFSDIKYLEKLKQHHLQKIGISIKAPNEHDFKKNTGSNQFKLVKQALNNLHKTNTQFNLSMVLSVDVIDNIQEWLNYIKELGGKYINFSFCKTPFDSDFPPENPKILIQKFAEKYDIINKKTNGKFSLHQTFPFCLWPINIIETMKQRNQLRSLCQLQYHSGLIVDTNLNLCVCNMLYDYPIGKLDDSITNGEDLNKFWTSDKINSIFKQLLKLPDKRCSGCNEVSYCAGGCAMQYFNYSLNDL